MRKLLNTLYVMTESCYLTLDGENIVIQNGENILARFPLHTLENVVCFTYKGATPALMGACAERKIGMSFFSPRGRFQDSGKRIWQCTFEKRTVSYF